MVTPDFVMPPELDSPAESETVPAEAPPQAEPRSVAAEPAVDLRRGLPWRQLVVAGLVGMLVGAALPAGVHALGQAAAEAEVQGLRATAMAYLTAIADGDSELATAMVPVEAGRVPPDAVLRSADRIEEIEVELVTVAGDQARVDVRYEIGAIDELRELAAERVDGEWKLTTSLAERVIVHSFDGAMGVTFGGVELAPDRVVLLYPGAYTADVIETPLLRSGGERFEVDGDPDTPSDLFANPMITEEFRDAAAAVANARVAACIEQTGCPYEPGTSVPENAELYIMGINRSDGWIEVMVPLGYVGSMGQWHEMPVRANIDEAGALVSWECGGAGRPDRDLETCSG